MSEISISEARKIAAELESSARALQSLGLKSKDIESLNENIENLKNRLEMFEKVETKALITKFDAYFQLIEKRLHEVLINDDFVRFSQSVKDAKRIRTSLVPIIGATFTASLVVLMFAGKVIFFS
jgi:hypothetical protein